MHYIERNISTSVGKGLGTQKMQSSSSKWQYLSHTAEERNSGALMIKLEKKSFSIQTKMYKICNLNPLSLSPSSPPSPQQVCPYQVKVFENTFQIFIWEHISKKNFPFTWPKGIISFIILDKISFKTSVSK